MEVKLMKESSETLFGGIKCSLSEGALWVLI